jgi:hypothetical protein
VRSLGAPVSYSTAALVPASAHRDPERDQRSVRNWNLVVEEATLFHR